ncbi:MAG: sigma-54 dependent transcriptional regulator [Capsulimonadales bacterium]|nr:sigma-54 dependent transcriptional regulator [Capsulimonadales bacterium]
MESANGTMEPANGQTNGQTILIVDDEPNLRRVLSAVLLRDGYNVIVADSGRDAIKKAKQQTSLDLLVTDFLMPDMNGLEVLESVRKQHPGLRALLISGHGTIRSAVEAMRLGAFDYLTKPFEMEQVRATVERALRARPTLTAPSPTVPGAAAVKIPVPSAATFGLVGEAPATLEMRDQLLRAAASRATVLLLGESGTGKEVAARLIHEASPRSRGAFVAVSCAALPESLLESELFGHEKSAFTGALAAKPGRFELADGGTLFLDEIGDIPHVTQVKLLRALQEREVSRIGGTKSTKVDVRVVAATNRDLWQAVQEGTFRLDLYYRLHVVPVKLPPLRNRKEDVRPLAFHFLARSSQENGRTFPGGITEEALHLMEQHDWPGNIRELQNVMEYAVVMSAPGTDRIESSALPTLIPSQRAAAERTRLTVVSGTR